ncbi:MAG: DUF5675 family protein [Gammaproteobacteria bacterium]|nr:DUF5675 family protein [Gammaproteobacteria bacterium]
MNYTINVSRGLATGTLSFTSGQTKVNTTCYWDTNRKIPAGTYEKCSATTMSHKKNSLGNPREAVYIPDVKGYSGIFIHMGKNPFENWSDGCIVIAENEMLKLYNAISPKNSHNVKVVITDSK